MRRGICRLVRFPAGAHEELVIAWFWSERSGVLSHQTALALHGLSDVLPAHVRLTLLSVWRHRRFRVPPDVVRSRPSEDSEHEATPHLRLSRDRQAGAEPTDDADPANLAAEAP